MLLRQLTTRRQILLSLLPPAIFGGLALAILHSALFQPLFQSGNRVLASPEGDMIIQFIPWREFGFGQLRHGNFPLWNPYIYGGTPYFAGFQSALLYPPNWLHLLLPVTSAINWIIALHLFGAGYFTYLWCRGRHASIGAAILAGTMFMFSGPYFLHIYAGHLANLAVMIWAPLLLLAIDKLNETGSPHWCLLGVLAVSMQILGGHPQYLYYTGLMSFLYAAILMIRSKHRLALAGGYLTIFVGASLIAAVQLLSGLQAAGESVRSQGTDFGFASMFALPPENLLTLFAPGIFGKLRLASDPADAVTYFGRCYLWEVSVFVSISGLVAATIGAIAGWRKTLPLSAIVVVTIVLALGKHLPLYRPMYNFFPEYSHFRVVAKFSFLMCLFISVLAAAGFDLLLTKPRTIKIAALVTGMMAIVFAVLALLLVSSSKDGGGPWRWLLDLIQQSNESYLPNEHYQQAAFIRSSQIGAAHSIGWAAATLGAICILLWVTRRKPRAAYALIVLAAVELFAFARGNVMTVPPDSEFPAAWLDVIRAAPRDFRVWNLPINSGAELEFVDEGMSLGIKNIWGYDPGVLKRYAQTLAAAQGINTDAASQYLEISGGSVGLFQMLRCRFGLVWKGDTPTAFELLSPLPVAQLVPNWVVEEKRDSELALINASDFNPRKTVVLESSPGIVPGENGVSGPAEVVDSSTDWVEIRTTTPTPTMLLITNNYSPGWRVVPLETTSQSSYQILPANYTLMAIPLQAGSHHLRIEYLPTAFRVGKWISILALLGYAGIFFGWVIRSTNRGGAGVRVS